MIGFYLHPPARIKCPDLKLTTKEAYALLNLLELTATPVGWFEPVEIVRSMAGIIARVHQLRQPKFPKPTILGWLRALNRIAILAYANGRKVEWR